MFGVQNLTNGTLLVVVRVEVVRQWLLVYAWRESINKHKRNILFIVLLFSFFAKNSVL